MFSVITNIYNKKTKVPTLMELFTATGKLKKFFLTTRDVRCVHDGWHCTHWYGIQVVATHASTYSSLLQWSVPLGQRGHVAKVGRIPGLWHIPKEKKSQVVISGDLGGHSISGWSFPEHELSNVLVTLCSGTDELHSGSGRDFRLAWIWTSVCSANLALATVAKYVSYGFPIIFFCNPGVHYETPCTITNTESVYNFVILETSSVKCIFNNYFLTKYFV